MKKIAFLLWTAIFNISCTAQEHKKEEKSQSGVDSLAQTTVAPKGSWKVDKEFDEDGNLIRYDSIYSWSSGDELEGLSLLDRDSTLQAMQSKFYRRFSQFEKGGFNDIFSPDSLFSRRFFDDDFFTSEFGEDFMDIDKMQKRMEAMQKKFLKKYQSEFEDPENDGSEENN